MTMHHIATQSGTGSSATITFSNIPQTFTHLQLRGTVRSSGSGGQIYTRVNGDGGTNYSSHYIYGDGSGVAAGGGGTGTVNYFGNMPASTDLANTLGSFVIDFLDYTNTNKNKTTKSINGYDLNGSGLSFFASSAWLNTAAITSISLVANQSFATVTQIDLYGIASNPIATGA